MNFDNEKWKYIDGYGKDYEVSNFGRVRSWKGNGMVKSRPLEPRLLKPNTNRDGYPYITLSKNKIPKSLTVHRIVAKAFVPNTDNKPCVNHIDGDKENNIADNLEWVTYSENSKHAYNAGLSNIIKGEKHVGAKLTRENVLDIRAVHNHGWFTQKEISEAYGVSQSKISHIVNRRSWRHI